MPLLHRPGTRASIGTALLGAAVAATGFAGVGIAAVNSGGAAAAAAVHQVGRAQVVSPRAANEVRLQAPAAARPGDLLLSSIGLRGVSHVAMSCPTGWSRVTDMSASPARLVTCWTIARHARQSATVSIRHRSVVGSITTAYRGVSHSRPIAAATGAQGTRVAVGGAKGGNLAVLTAVAAGRAGRVTAPTGARLVAAAGSGQPLQLATALGGSQLSGSTWHTATKSSTVNGSVTLQSAATTTSQGITTVGTATKASTKGGASLTTAFPTGVTSTDLVVSAVETYNFAAVTCPSGWVKSVNAATSANTRLAVCTGWAGSATSDTVGVSPGTQATMVTGAFRGVNAATPVDTTSTATGTTSPAVQTAAAGEELVLAQGSSAWQASASISSATLLATANNGGNSQVALAATAASAAGTTGSHAWSVRPKNPDSLAATLPSCRRRRR